jgi:hypothetical protein
MKFSTSSHVTKTRRPTRDGRRSPLSTKRWTVRSQTLRISDTSARVSSSKPLRWCALVMTGPLLFTWFVWRRSGAVPVSCATGGQNILWPRGGPQRAGRFTRRASTCPVAILVHHSVSAKASAAFGSRHRWTRIVRDRPSGECDHRPKTVGFVALQRPIALLYRRLININGETGMTFKEAASAYIAAAQNYSPRPAAKPSPSQSSATHGTWYLRDRKGNQVARVSGSGVRFAGSNEFAHKKGARRGRARP